MRGCAVTLEEGRDLDRKKKRKNVDCVSAAHVWKDLIAGESQASPSHWAKLKYNPLLADGKQISDLIGRWQIRNTRTAPHPSRVICLWCVLTRPRRTARGDIHLSTQRRETFSFFFSPPPAAAALIPGAL